MTGASIAAPTAPDVAAMRTNRQKISAKVGEPENDERSGRRHRARYNPHAGMPSVAAQRGNLQQRHYGPHGEPCAGAGNDLHRVGPAIYLRHPRTCFERVLNDAAGYGAGKRRIEPATNSARAPMEERALHRAETCSFDQRDDEHGGETFGGKDRHRRHYHGVGDHRGADPSRDEA